MISPFYSSNNSASVTVLAARRLIKYVEMGKLYGISIGYLNRV